MNQAQAFVARCRFALLSPGRAEIAAEGAVRLGRCGASEFFRFQDGSRLIRCEAGGHVDLRAAPALGGPPAAPAVATSGYLNQAPRSIAEAEADRAAGR